MYFLAAQEIAEAAHAPPPHPNDQALLKSGIKSAGKSKAKAAAETTYCLKLHKRKDCPTAVAIFNKKRKKQIVQLLDNVVDDCGAKMEGFVKELNDGTMDEPKVIQIVSEMKRSQA